MLKPGHEEPGFGFGQRARCKVRLIATAREKHGEGVEVHLGSNAYQGTGISLVPAQPTVHRC
jgi:hypothetical protein